VKVGDTVSVVWRGKTHVYRVSKLFTVGPDDTWIMRQTGAERLTLYTCLPRTVGNKRTVVVALPVAQ
jgi:LPXTG-site transpeptidase (sortase) family protein